MGVMVIVSVTELPAVTLSGVVLGATVTVGGTCGIPKIMMRKHSGGRQRGDDRKMKKVATFGACCTLQTAGRPLPLGVS